MSLYEIYIDYKNGDKAAFDRIFTDRVNGLGSDDYNSCLEINVQELAQLVNELYQERRKTLYCGDLEDLKQDVALIIFQLFSDDMFAAHSEKELYDKIKGAINELVSCKN